MLYSIWFDLSTVIGHFNAMPTPLTTSPKLLDHPWYRAWECGALPREALRTYASEYYWQVANFPRYLSRLHSQLPDLKSRQVLLSNLMDEENPSSPHPELWLDFAASLGLDRQAVAAGTPSAATCALVEQFHALVAASPEEGLGAILAYESQVPAIARFKGKALKDHYLATAAQQAQGTRFFAVHEEADQWHTAALERLVDALPQEQKRNAQDAANIACSALWKFLDAMPH